MSPFVGECFGENVSHLVVGGDFDQGDVTLGHFTTDVVMTEFEAFVVVRHLLVMIMMWHEELSSKTWINSCGMHE